MEEEFGEGGEGRQVRVGYRMIDASRNRRISTGRP